MTNIRLTITVAIVTRNRAELLKETLESLCELDRRPDEVLVISNCSTDNTIETAGLFRPRLPVRVENWPEIGVNRARNAALSLCRTDILVFTDDDAIPRKDWLSKLEHALALAPDTAAFQGVKDNFYPDSLFACLFQFCSRDIAQLRSHHNGIVISSALVDTCNLAIRMEKIRAMGIRFDESFLKGGDRFFGQTLLEHGETIAFAEDSVVAHKWPRTLKSYLQSRWRSGAARSHIAQKSNPKYNQATARKLSKRQYLSALVSRTQALDLFPKMLFYPLVALGIFLNKCGALHHRLVRKGSGR